MLIKLNLLFKVLFLNSKLAQTLGYLNPTLNNLALVPVVLKDKRWITLSTG